MHIQSRLDELGVTIPTVPKPLAAYIPAMIVEGSPPQLWVAGQVPLSEGSPIATGRLGDDVDLETARACARQCTLNALAAAAGVLDGDLDRIQRAIKLACFVACTADFTDHPQVANGASELLGQIMDEKGAHVRAAVGVASLPLGVPVEIEFVFQLKD